MGQALEYYLQANDKVLPPSGSSFERIHKYVQKVSTKKASDTLGEVEVDWYRCPGDEIPHDTDQITRDLANGSVQRLFYDVSYGINTPLVWAVRPDTPGCKDGVLRKMSSVKRLTDIVSFCDAADDDFNGAGEWLLSEQNDTTNQAGHEIHHKIGNNFLYCDGHVLFHKALLEYPPQYGLPPFPRAWIPNYTTGEYDDWERPAPHH